MKKDNSKKFIYMFIVILLVLLIVFFVYKSKSENDVVEPSPSNTPIQSIAISSPTSEPTTTNTPEPTPVPTVEITPTEVAFIDESLADLIVDDFDYFILALSWNPTFCATTNNPNSSPCYFGKTNLSFILHGLWPIFYQGYPSYCSTETMSTDLIDEYPDVYPNDFLYTHEWDKHGTCTGLDPVEYILVSQQLKNSINIPDEFESPKESFEINADELVEAFAKINPDYSMDSFSVFCSEPNGLLNELYICYTRDGQPTSCGEEVVEVNNASCGDIDFQVLNPQ